MKDDVNFTKTALEQYSDWALQDRKKFKKILKLIEDIQRNGLMQGEGKPEPLKYRPGYSRRIDEDNRLVYDIREDNLLIISCKGHYKDK